jgi:hypothetical protein
MMQFVTDTSCFLQSDNFANTHRDVAGILVVEAGTKGRRPTVFLEHRASNFEEAVRLQIYSRYFTRTRAERESANTTHSQQSRTKRAHTTRVMRHPPAYLQVWLPLVPRAQRPT